MGDKFKEHDDALDEVFGKKKSINPVQKADIILKNHELIYCANEFYKYEDGYYRQIQELNICMWIKRLLSLAFTKNRSNEIIHCLKTETLIDLDELNHSDFLNVRNGMLDLNNFELLPHKKEYRSTIRLNVDYDKTIKCPKWEAVLLDMFEGNKTKVSALQEYFGLCLTKSTEYEKSLFLTGGGSNGKSVVLYVLCEILGRQNYSAIPMELFEKSHYIASLFGKLANISIETDSKSRVYDSMFKAIVSGDPIEADRKYQSSFVFRPFCKLIFALNKLPRVDDKTVAFFRRLLIINFGKQYSEEEQDKRLKYDLVRDELSGIFIWALEGLKRLRKRGNFQIDMNMHNDVLLYQQENNNVLVFVDEKCDFQAGARTYIKDLYESYKDWCLSDGYKPSSKKNFVKEIDKNFKNVKKDRTRDGRQLEGICLFVRTSVY